MDDLEKPLVIKRRGFINIGGAKSVCSKPVTQLEALITVPTRLYKPIASSTRYLCVLQ